MSAVPVSADRRFRRAPVKPARRRGRARSIAVATLKAGLPLALIFLLAYRGAELVNTAPVFQIRTLAVSGNVRMPTGEILGLLGELRGVNIVSADLDTWRERLEASPWIREARFRRSLPSTVRVFVSERQPIGIARLKGRLYLVDDRGAVIAEYGPAYADLDLPIIDGLESSPGPDGTADEPRAALAGRLIADLAANPAIAGRLSQINVADLHNAALIINGDPAVIYIGEERFLERLESYLGLASALRDRVANIDYVDLRFDDRIYVRPTSRTRRKTNVALAAPDGWMSTVRTSITQR
jgi:cell division protein FtsQ